MGRKYESNNGKMYQHRKFDDGNIVRLFKYRRLDGCMRMRINALTLIHKYS